MTTNSFGGTDLHQELLDQYIKGVFRGMESTPEGVYHPNLPALMTAATTIVLPYNDPRIDALAQGREGVTDGKVWLIQQDVLVEKAYEAVLGSEALAWFEESLLEVFAIAQGGQGQHLQAIDSQDLADALSPWLDTNRPQWRELMGYDAARLQEKPVLHALKLWQEKGAAGFAVDKRLLLTGDYNQHSQDMLAFLTITSPLKATAQSESFGKFTKEFGALFHKKHVHSDALYSMAAIGLANQYFGVLSLSDEELLHFAFNSFKDIAREIKTQRVSLSTEGQTALYTAFSNPKMVGPGYNFDLKSSLIPPFDENKPFHKTLSQRRPR